MKKQKRTGYTFAITIYAIFCALMIWIERNVELNSFLSILLYLIAFSSSCLIGPLADKKEAFDLKRECGRTGHEFILEKDGQLNEYLWCNKCGHYEKPNSTKNP